MDKKRGGINDNDIYWNFMFNNRHINLPKSFIKIKIRSDMMIEIIYRCNGEEFKEDDLIQVIKRDPFTEEKTMIIGRVIKSLINTELVLDISSKYHAENITINMDESVNVNKIN